MSNEGIFRTSMSGFNKKDVHKYIDGIMLSHSEAIAEKENEINRLREELSSAATDKEAFADEASFDETLVLTAKIEEKDVLLKELEAKIDLLEKSKTDLEDALLETREDKDKAAESERKSSELKARIDELALENAKLKEESAAAPKNELAFSYVDFETLKSKEALLNSQNLKLAEEKDSYRRKLHECQELLARAERKIQDLTIKSEKNDALVSDVGAFVVDLHSIGQSLLDASYLRSKETLDLLENAVRSLSDYTLHAERAVGEARQSLAESKDLSKTRLEEMIKSLKERK